MTFRLRSKQFLKLLDVKVPSKYHAERQMYNGRHYDSKLEANYAGELEYRRIAGEIKEYTPQVKLELRVKGHLVCTYKIDFEVIHKDGTVEYVEVKGYETPEWRLKWKLFEALYSDMPGVKLTVVK